MKTLKCWLASSRELVPENNSIILKQVHERIEMLDGELAAALGRAPGCRTKTYTEFVFAEH